MRRDCKAMEAIDVEAKDMNRKNKEVKGHESSQFDPLVGRCR